MTARSTLTSLVLCLLTACATNVARQEPHATAPARETNAEHDPSTRRAEIPASMMRETNLEAPGDLLIRLYQAMRAYNPVGDGTRYFISDDNALDAYWIQQTPNVWGLSADQVRPGAGRTVAYEVRSLIAGAQRFVDITNLASFPTGEFRQAIINGLAEVARSGRPVTVRILVGWWPETGGSGSGGSGGGGGSRLNQSDYLKQIVAQLRGIPGSNLKIYVGAQQVWTPLEWNHSKIIAVDAQYAMVGGENLWDSDYLQVYPAHDLNVALRGSFVVGLHNFADYLWGHVCGYWSGEWKPAYWESGWNDVGSRCLEKNGLQRRPGPGRLRVLGAGRLGSLAGSGNPADVAMLLAYQSSTSTIRIAQQDIGYTDPIIGSRWWWDEGMKALAAAVVKRQHVYIVLSDDNAKAGPDGVGYWNSIPIRDTADKLREYVVNTPGAPTGPALRDLLCSNLHLAPLRFGPSDRWPNGWAFANHPKFFMIDDSLFYVGSENFYPVSLQEYGVFMDDASAAAQIKEAYWDKLWQYSSRAAISGNGPTNCHFR